MGASRWESISTPAASMTTVVWCDKQRTSGRHYRHHRRDVEQCVKQHTREQHCQYHHLDIELRDMERHRLACVHV